MNNFNQNSDVNHIYQNIQKNDIVSSPSSGSSRSSSRSNSKQQQQQRNDLIKVYSNKSNHDQKQDSRSRTRSANSNSTSKSSSRSPSSIHSSKESVKNKEKYVDKNKDTNTKLEKKQNVFYTSDPRSRHNFSPDQIYHHNDNIKKRTNNEVLRSHEDFNEKYKKRRSRTPDNLYESELRYNKSKKLFQPDYFQNAPKAENYSKRDKNYDSNDYSRKNEKLYKREDYENNHRNEIKEHDHEIRYNHRHHPHDHHHHQQHQQLQIKQTRIDERRPSSRDRDRKNYVEEEEERERYAGDYTSICLKNLNETLRADDLREHIYNEFKAYKNFTVKVVNNRKASLTHSSTSHNSEKIAFVNFICHADAKHAKKSKSNKLFFGNQLYIEPVFRNRSSINDSIYSDEGSSVRSSSRRHNMTPPLRNHRRSFTPTRTHNYHDRSRSKTPQNLTNQMKKRDANSTNAKHRQQLSFSRSRSPSLYKTTSQYNNYDKDIIKNRYSNTHESSKMNFPNEDRKDYLRSEKYLIEKSLSPKLRHEDYGEKRTQIKKSSTRIDQFDLTKESPKNRNESFENESIQDKNDKKSEVEITKVNFSSKYLSNSDQQDNDSIIENTNNKSNNRIDDKKLESSVRNKSPIKIIHSRSRSLSPFNSNHENKDFITKNIVMSDNNSEVKRARNNRKSPSIPKNDARISPKVVSNYGGVSHYFDNDERDATRTLFVGNLDNHIETKDLIPIFENYGIIEEIDIKRNQPILPSYQLNNIDYFMNSNLSASKKKTYAFIKYFNMDMAIAAKHHLNGTKLGKYQTECKIGYGKVQSTNCLWVGGLTEKTKRSDLEAEFEYFAMTTIQKSIAKASKQDILYKKLAEFNWRPNGELFAYILFPTISQAEEARNQMRGIRLPNYSSERLRIDYVDPKKFRHSRGHSRSRSPNISNVSPPINMYSRRETMHQSKNMNRYDENRNSNGHSSSRHRDEKSPLKLINDEKYLRYERSSRSRSPRKLKLEENSNKFYKDLRGAVPDRYLNKRSYGAIRSESNSPVFNKTNDLLNQNDSKNRNATCLSPTHDKVLNTVENVSEIFKSNFESKKHEQSNKSNIEDQSSKESNTRLFKKSKTFDTKALLSGAKLENIIITKTDHTRQVNKLSDLINSNQNDNRKEKKIDIKPLSPHENSYKNIESEEVLKINSQTTEIDKPSIKENDTNDQSIKNQVKKEEELKENQIKDKISEEKPSAIESEIQEEKTNKNDEIQEVSKIKNIDHQSEKNESEMNKEELKNETTDKIDETINKKSSNLKTSIDSLKLINVAHINKNILNNNLKSIEQVRNLIEDTWSGVFTLKKHIFPTKFFLIAGCKEFAKQILPQQDSNKSSSYNCLRISQRLRLDDSKLDELEKKIYEMNHQTTTTTTTKLDSTSSFSLLISVPSDQLNEFITENQYHQRSLHNLITYLDQKNAAGVIPLPDDDKPNSMMHAFTPNCVLSNKLLKQLFPHIKKVINTNNFVNNDFIVIILFKQNSTTNGSNNSN